MTKDSKDVDRKLAKLAALEAGGVDNWEGYDFALEEWHKENAFDEFVADMVDELHEALVDAEVDYPAGREAGPSVSLDYEDSSAFIKMVVERYDRFLNKLY